MPTASLSIRFLAFLIDSFIIFSLSFSYLYSLFKESDFIALLLVANFLNLIYGAFLDSSPLKGTFGKAALGLQVVDLQGRKISIRTSLIRNLIKTLTIDLCFIGFIFFMLNLKSQTLHDMLTKTLVIKKFKNPKADHFSHPLYEKTKNHNQLDL